MEDQNISPPAENIFPKMLSFIFRGTLGGMIGGVTVVFMFEVINRLSSLISKGSSLISQFYIFDTFVGSFLLAVVTLVIPIGLVIGISTGIPAAIFEHHCPKLFSWLVLCWIGVITGFWLSGLGSKGWLSSNFLLELSFISLATSCMAYKSTIQEIKNDVPKEAWWAYTILSSISYLLLIFILIYPYFKFWNYLINIPS